MSFIGAQDTIWAKAGIQQMNKRMNKLCLLVLQSCKILTERENNRAGVKSERCAKNQINQMSLYIYIFRFM